HRPVLPVEVAAPGVLSPGDREVMRRRKVLDHSDTLRQHLPPDPVARYSGDAVLGHRPPRLTAGSRARRADGAPLRSSARSRTTWPRGKAQKSPPGPTAF